MSNSPKLGLTRLVAGQANGEQTANTDFNVVDVFSGVIQIQDRDLTTPPGSPAEGDAYVIGGTPAGAWATATTLGGAASASGDIAVYFNGWIIVKPVRAMMAFVVDEKIWFAYSPVESLWHPMQEIWSTTEGWTGKYNGSSLIYAKSFLATTLPAASSVVSIAHGISSLDLDKRIRAELRCYDAAGSLDAFHLPIDYGGTAPLNYSIDATNIHVVAGAFDMSSWKVDVRMEYCR